MSAAYAQRISVSGTVLDAGNNEPLIGVAVMEKGTTNGTITDMDGKFMLQADADATLELSYMGYVTQEIPAASAKDIVISMAEESQALDELVVIGYGV